MRIFLLLFWLSFCGVIEAAEFSASIPGTPAVSYALPLSDFFFADDGTAELRTNFGLSRMQPNGAVQQTTYSSQGAVGQVKHRLAFEGDVIELFEFNLGFQGNRYSVRRITVDGMVRFFATQPINPVGIYSTATASIKADGNGGFWLLWTTVMHVSAAGEITVLTPKYGTAILVSDSTAVIFSGSEITRLPLIAAPSPQQSIRIDPTLNLICMHSTDAGHWVALAARRIDGGQYGLFSLAIDSPGIVTSETAVGVVSSYYGAPCTHGRSAIRYVEGPRQKLLMLDTQYREQWRITTDYIQTLAIGPDGQAAAYDGNSETHFTRFSETGQMSEIGGVFLEYLRMRFDEGGSLWITAVNYSTPAPYLQVLRFPVAYNTQRPDQIYDLPMITKTVETLAGALENGKVELLTRGGNNYGPMQSWHIDERGANLLYQQPASEFSIDLAGRLANTWVIHGYSPVLDQLLLIAKSSAGATIFTRQQEMSLMSCNLMDCEFFGSGGAGRIDLSGQLSDFVVASGSIQALYPAPNRRAGLLSDGRLGQIVNGQMVFGPALPIQDAIQLADGKFWATNYASLYLTDAGGYPLFIRECASCYYILDYNDKTAYEITAFAANTQIRRVQTDGNYSQPLSVPIIQVQSITGEGELLWLRGAGANGPVIYALQQATGAHQIWSLDANAAPVLRPDGNGPMHFVAPNVLFTVDSISQGRDNSLSVRRFEFDSMLRDGFE